MAGINHLSEIYKKKGKKFVDDLFNNEVTVTENLDGPSFSFERHYTDNGISFYKKNQDNPITLIDRILMTYYEKPINYINALPEETKNDLPKGWRFGLVYFPDKNPVRIEYDRIPKNHLILTHISIRDEFGDVTETIQDKKTLDEWAEIIGVEKPPFIFQGRLNDNQKMEIMDFLSTPLDELINKFKTESFSKYLISILNPDMSETTLGNSLESQIDSLVFRFGNPDDEDEDIVLAKMVDPVFREMSRDRKGTTQSSYFPSDIYSLCLTEVMNFILEKGIESFEAEGIEPEERYVNFVFDVFKKFIASEGDRYRGADFEKPEYLNSDNFTINKELIPDEGVVSIIEDEEAFSDIFQMILNSFRKLKRKPYGFFNKGLIEQFNFLVGEIASYINAKKKENLEESFSLPTFSRFKKIYKDFNIYEEEDEMVEEKIMEKPDEVIPLNESDSPKLEKEEENTSEFFSFKNFKKVISTHKEKRKTKILNESSQDINLIIGKFQPFNNGHYKMCNRVKKENDLPVFLCVVHPGSTNDEYPFSKDLIKKSVGGVVSDNPDLFAGFEMVDNNLLESSINRICEKYNAASLTVGEENFENAVLQREWIKEKYDMGNSNIEIYKTPRWSDNNNVRSYIDNDDFSSFKSKVPKNIAILFNEYLRERKDIKEEKTSEDN